MILCGIAVLKRPSTARTTELYRKSRCLIRLPCVMPFTLHGVDRSVSASPYAYACCTCTRQEHIHLLVFSSHPPPPPPLLSLVEKCPSTRALPHTPQMRLFEDTVHPVDFEKSTQNHSQLVLELCLHDLCRYTRGGCTKKTLITS